MPMSLPRSAVAATSTSAAAALHILLLAQVILPLDSVGFSKVQTVGFSDSFVRCKVILHVTYTNLTFDFTDTRRMKYFAFRKTVRLFKLLICKLV